jgi:hypothetical protein
MPADGVRVELYARIERQKPLLAVVTGTVPDDIVTWIDLEVKRPRAIGDDVELEGRVAHMDAIDARFLEQIDRGRAKELQI